MVLLITSLTRNLPLVVLMLKYLLALAIIASSSSSTFGQSSVPTVTYDPSTGHVFFVESDELLGSIFFALESVGSNLTPENAADVYLNLVPSTTRPGAAFFDVVNFSGGNAEAMLWAGISDDFVLDSSDITPGFAGKIVSPGTDVSDLTFSYIPNGPNGPGAPMQGLVLVVPEPSATILVAFCILSIAIQSPRKR